MCCFKTLRVSDIILDDLTTMFNATLAGHQPHHLRADYSGSRGGSRASSRYDINEVGRLQVSSGSSALRSLKNEMQLFVRPSVLPEIMTKSSLLICTDVLM